ncbi:MAG: alpha/beta fold hydrolase [Paracoccaceae bacterium]
MRRNNQKGPRRGAQTSPPLGRFVAVSGARLHLYEAGAGTGVAEAQPTLVLLHGASGNLRDFTLSILPPLAEAHRVVAVDRPGFGYSTALGEGWRLSVQRQAIGAALRQTGHDRLVLVGHSYAGALALDWALAEPDRIAGLVLLAGATMDWGGALDTQYTLLAAPILGQAAAALAPRLIGSARLRRALEGIFAPQPVPERYFAEGGIDLALRPETLRTNARMLTALHAQIREMAPRYGEIRAPALVVHGEADRIVPARIHGRPLAARLPEAEGLFLDGVGHMPHHADAHGLAARISRFASGL